MNIINSFIRKQGGSAITEFALSSIILIFALMGTIEFGFEVFLRQQAELSAGEAAHNYAMGREPSDAQNAANEHILPAFRTCVAPLSIVIYNSLGELGSDAGREAAGDSSDDSAVIAKITSTCTWGRIVPITRAFLGSEITHSTTAIVRLR